MNVMEEIASININIDGITDENTRSIIVKLLNIIEKLAAENVALKIENQKLRDENNRLKGEQGKPKIRPQANNKNNKDISSEDERKNQNQDKKAKKSKNKKNKITIDRTETCVLNKEELPEDAIFKGYEKVIIQDIRIMTNNIEFKREMFYSPSLGKTFLAPLPAGYEGEFGPNIKNLIITQHFMYKMTEPAIVQFLRDQGIQISAATVSRIITDNHDPFHAEKQDIVQAGLSSTVYQQTDDTGARVNGKNFCVHVLCNQNYTAYFTRPNKDRLTVLEILAQQELKFHFNESSYALMEHMGLSEKVLTALKQKDPASILDRAQVDTLLNDLFQNPKKTHKKSKRIIIEASAITAYQQLPHAVKILLADDAPQFKRIAEELALCWIHDGRHYKKLDPVVDLHRIALNEFLTNYWEYYGKLLAYKATPTKEVAKNLVAEFDTLFTTVTEYADLDDRIHKTLLKKDSLLLVLQHPELPLHNNNSELAARAQARYRDISLQNQNIKGTEAKDTFMTIVATAQKLGVNAYNYILDRISKRYKMPSLASLIGARTVHHVCNSS
jgi:hypothetical protein